MSLLVLGTASHVGKSTVVAAICRCLSNRGIAVSPFKSQNMSLNSAVTQDGAEIAIAQVMQAAAARVPPDADMNPVLLKPKGSSISQVIVLGKPYKDVQIRKYYEETDKLLKIAVQSANRLARRYGQIICEGAGSAAEVNLYSRDIANILLARALSFPIILVADIERGGIFAQVYGTVALLPPDIRPLVKGVIINKFRGDPSLFNDGVTILEDLSGVPVLGVLPHASLELPSEDSLSLGDKEPSPLRMSALRIAVVRLPHISNFTDFELLERHASVTYIPPGASLSGYDAVIIPGTKNTIEDLEILKKNGFAVELTAARERKTPIIGICGGYQMLGKRITDRGIESKEGVFDGFGLLDAHTVFEEYRKTTRQVGRKAMPVGPILDRIGEVTGYEIHMGRTDLGSGSEAFEGDGAVSSDGLVIGTYMHGLFQNPAVVNSLLGYLCMKRNIPFDDISSEGPDPYETLASLFEEHVDMDRLLPIILG
jgi:adenosylcobyric acid synthase